MQYLWPVFGDSKDKGTDIASWKETSADMIAKIFKAQGMEMPTAMVDKTAPLDTPAPINNN